MNRPIQRALLSVSDKQNILELATALTHLNIEILSTGGTAKLLAEHNIPVIEVSDHTGFPEIMGGRVKTLHPKIHGGILARRGTDELVMQENQIAPIDLVVVNLYPFAQTITKENCTLEEAVENIDIGGPTMIRSAAKNFDSVTVIVDPNDYADVIAQLNEKRGLTQSQRFHYSIKAFEHTAQYDDMIANYFGKLLPSYHDERESEQATVQSEFPRTLNFQFIKKQDLRYGENTHQNAAFYVDNQNLIPSISTAVQLQGKALSYNNIADTDAALECVLSFDEPACVIVKHANPCGVAVNDNHLTAYLNAFKTDPTSAFGGIIAFNGPVDEATAKAIIERQFVEVIIAPSFSQSALAALANKPNVRVLACGERSGEVTGYDFKRVTGGLLVQERDLALFNQSDLKIVTQRQPTQNELDDLLFCWKVAKFVKSNAIVYAKDKMTIGVGAGQMSRVYSAKIAGIKAEDEGLTVSGSVMASDAFFPFRDGVDAAAAVGVKAIIQPGGSIRDEEVIQAANEHNIAMIFTQMRHFRH